MIMLNFLGSRTIIVLIALAVIAGSGAGRAQAQDEDAYRKALSEAYLQANPSEYRGKAFKDYCRSLYNADKRWPEAKPFVLAKFNEMIEIDFYAAYLGILTDNYYFNESVKIFATLPQDQRAAISIIAGWTVANSPVNKDVPPNIPYPSGVPKPGYGWGKTVSSNQRPISTVTTAETDQKLAKANEALANVARLDGQIKFGEKNYTGALARLDDCIRLSPRSARCYELRGMTHAKLNDHKAAILDFTEAIKILPTDFHHFNQRATSYIRINDHERALADLTESLRLNPGADNNAVRELYADVKKYVAMGKDIEKRKKDLTLLKDFEPLKKLEEAIKLQMLGSEQNKQKNFDAAIATYTDCLRLVPDQSACLMGRGNAYTGKMFVLNPSTGDPKMMDLALADYAAAIRKSDSILGLAYYNRGVLYRNVKKYPLAIADYKLALASTRLTEAQAQTVKKVLGDDEKLYARELVNLSVAAFQLAVAAESAGDMAGRTKHSNDAIQLLTRAIELDKTNANYYLGRGVLYKGLNNNVAAIADFRAGLKLNPNSVELTAQLKALGVEP